MDVTASRGEAARAASRRRAKAEAGRPHVEVRVGRRGRALRVDGTFASWYEPGQVLTGSVWDVLAAPLLLLPKSRRRSALLLGLGGGSAARILRALDPDLRIVGVEASREVLRAARRWLDLDRLGIEVVEADAHEYLRRARGRHDLVIEDIFVGRGRALHKPDWLPAPGLELALRRLQPRGVLVVNAIDEARAAARELRRLLPSGLAIHLADYDNCVLVGSRDPIAARRLRTALRRDPLLCGSLPCLRFRALNVPPPGTRARFG
jgi:spermidine synthase